MPLSVTLQCTTCRKRREASAFHARMGETTSNLSSHWMSALNTHAASGPHTHHLDVTFQGGIPAYARRVPGSRLSPGVRYTTGVCGIEDACLTTQKPVSDCTRALESNTAMYLGQARGLRQNRIGLPDSIYVRYRRFRPQAGVAALGYSGNQIGLKPHTCTDFQRTASSEGYGWPEFRLSRVFDNIERTGSDIPQS